MRPCQPNEFCALILARSYRKIPHDFKKEHVGRQISKQKKTTAADLSLGMHQNIENFEVSNPRGFDARGPARLQTATHLPVLLIMQSEW